MDGLVPSKLQVDSKLEVVRKFLIWSADTCLQSASVFLKASKHRLPRPGISVSRTPGPSKWPAEHPPPWVAPPSDPQESSWVQCGSLHLHLDIQALLMLFCNQHVRNLQVNWDLRNVSTSNSITLSSRLDWSIVPSAIGPLVFHMFHPFSCTLDLFVTKFHLQKFPSTGASTWLPGAERMSLSLKKPSRDGGRPWWKKRMGTTCHRKWHRTMGKSEGWRLYYCTY